MREAPARILVMCLAGVGDVLMATPLLRELRLAYPAATIDVLVLQGTASRDILGGNPDVDTVVLHDFRKESLRRSLAFCLSWRGRYDLSINTYPQNRLEYNLLSWLIGAKRRIGFRYAVRCWGMERMLQTVTLPENEALHFVENNLRIMTEVLGEPLRGGSPRLAVHPRPENRVHALEFMAQRGIEGKRLIGIHPGSGTTKNLVLKRWPARRWGELVQILCGNPDVRLLLFGTPDEAALRAEIRDLAGDSRGQVIDVGNLPLMDSVCLIERLQLLVCSDALLSHVAAAVQIPSVVLFGPTPSVATRPYASKTQIVRRDLPCSPCYRISPRGIRCVNPDKMACMEGLEVAEVLKAMRLLDGYGESSRGNK